jgi:lipoprotein-anchoring transpeptidase ErfK/SrfK
MLGAMVADLESLYILSPDDIIRFRNYIAEKYPFQNAASRAKTLANAVHRVIDKELQAFSDLFKGPLRTAVLDLAVSRGVFQVRGDDIFYTALGLAGFAKDALLALSAWIKTRLGRIVSITALQQMALQLRQRAFSNLSKPVRPADLDACQASSDPLWYSPAAVLTGLPENADVKRAVSNLSGLRIPAPFGGLFLLDYIKQLPPKAARIEWPPLKQYLENAWSNTLSLLQKGLRRFVLPAATASVLCLAAGLSMASLSSGTAAGQATASSNQVQSIKASPVIPYENSQTASAPVWNELTTRAPEKAPVKPATPNTARQDESSAQPKPRNSTPVRQTAPPAAPPQSVSNQSTQTKNAAVNQNLARLLAYHSVDQKKLRAYLKAKDSLLASEPYFSSIISVSRQHNLNPLLLFAIAGQEQALVPRGSSDAALIANNPFNVYGSWLEYNTSINDSANIAANTIVALSKGRPANADPLAWINRKYASDPNWYKGVGSFLQELERVVK